MQVSRQALKSFEYRLDNAGQNEKSAQSACLSFIPQLSDLIVKSPDRLLQLSALTCIDRISEIYGRKNTAIIEAAMTVVSGEFCLGSTDKELEVAGLLCLSTSVEVLGDEFTSHLPGTLKTTLGLLSSSISTATRSTRLHNACYSFLAALLLHMAWMVTGPSLDSILQVSHDSADTDMDEECISERRTTLRLMAKRIEAKECLATLDRTWIHAVNRGPTVRLVQLITFTSVILTVCRLFRNIYKS